MQNKPSFVYRPSSVATPPPPAAAAAATLPPPSRQYSTPGVKPPLPAAATPLDDDEREWRESGRLNYHAEAARANLSKVPFTPKLNRFIPESVQDYRQTTNICSMPLPYDTNLSLNIFRRFADGKTYWIERFPGTLWINLDDMKPIISVPVVCLPPGIKDGEYIVTIDGPKFNSSYFSYLPMANNSRPAVPVSYPSGTGCYLYTTAPEGHWVEHMHEGMLMLHIPNHVLSIGWLNITGVLIAPGRDDPYFHTITTSFLKFYRKSTPGPANQLPPQQKLPILVPPVGVAMIQLPPPPPPILPPHPPPVPLQTLPPPFYPRGVSPPTTAAAAVAAPPNITPPPLSPPADPNSISPPAAAAADPPLIDSPPYPRPSSPLPHDAWHDIAMGMDDETFNRKWFGIARKEGNLLLDH